MDASKAVQAGIDGLPRHEMTSAASGRSGEVRDALYPAYITRSRAEATPAQQFSICDDCGGAGRTSPVDTCRRCGGGGLLPNRRRVPVAWYYEVDFHDGEGYVPVASLHGPITTTNVRNVRPMIFGPACCKDGVSC
jgi:hypothetical protein